MQLRRMLSGGGITSYTPFPVVLGSQDTCIASPEEKVQEARQDANAKVLIAMQG